MQMDDEILRDFLIEAGEILEQLDSQLIQLEATPGDRGLLNAVFRGFHTIKGGAGFLSLDSLVEVSHKAEDVFDLLRNDRCVVTPHLMDAMLCVLDALRGMFDELREGRAPTAASPDLIAQLAALARGESAPESSAAAARRPDLASASPIADAQAGPSSLAAEPAVATDVAGEFDTVVADMLREHAAPSVATEAAASGSADDLIMDDEFEALLDSPQGQRARATANAAVSAAAAPPAPVGDMISDDEFESLLDHLHGVGRFAPPPVAVPVAATPRKTEAAEPTDTVAKDNTIRVSTEVLDRIMNMVGELVLIRNRLSNLQAGMGDAEMAQAVASLDVVTSDLQMAAMKTRMQPIKKVFGRFPRVVRDLARSLRKEIELEMAGEDTDLDKNLVEALSDPLVHLVRNACDHGIETPDERMAAGKSRAGTLRLSAEQEGDRILLTIQDNGKGMDADGLRTKAVEKGLLDLDSAARLTERECFELIFLPGFSTKEQISDVSGRGVGMDVVKTRISQLNGSIEIDSRLGIGTVIRIRVPLTLAIMPTLMVMLGHQIFALPLVNVKEIIDFRDEQSRDVNGKKMLVVRGKALPLYYLSRWLVRGIGGSTVGKGHVVVVSIGNQPFALLVDELIGQEEVVIKPLGAMLHGTRGLSGATITGNGRIALILDLPELIEAYARCC